VNCGGHDPFASRVGHTGFVWTQSSLDCVVLKVPNRICHRELLSLRDTWALITFHSPSRYMFIE